MLCSYSGQNDGHGLCSMFVRLQDAPLYIMDGGRLGNGIGRYLYLFPKETVFVLHHNFNFPPCKSYK